MHIVWTGGGGACGAARPFYGTTTFRWGYGFVMLYTVWQIG